MTIMVQIDDVVREATPAEIAVIEANQKEYIVLGHTENATA